MTVSSISKGCIRQITGLPERVQFERLCTEIWRQLPKETKAVDIGGPSRIFHPLYRRSAGIDIVNFSTENTWGKLGKDFTFRGQKKGCVIKNDATDLKDISDDNYDAVLSSNNLEHIANPLKAVLEWKRILKRKGMLVILVPAKEYTFDHRRKTVSFTHLLEDYNNGVGEDDLSHLDEILELHDLEMDPPAGTPGQFRERSLHNYENRCLHQHVFDAQVLEETAAWAEMEVISTGLLYRGNHLLVCKK